MKSQTERKQKNARVGWEKVKQVECQVKGFPPNHPQAPQPPILLKGRR
jgi:hypothetical protein